MMNVTNKYLKSSIKDIINFFKNNTAPPEDLYVNLLLELRVSNLLIPTVFDGDNFSFPTVETDNGEELIPLFTDEDEMGEYGEELFAFSNEIFYYIEMLNNLGFDGILINPQSDDFSMDREILNTIPNIKTSNAKNAYDPLKLKEIALSKTNYKLKKFIRDESNFNNFEELSKLLVNSTLLNAAVSSEDLSGYVRDGIIDRQESGTFSFYTKHVSNEDYGLIFTDKEALEAFHENTDYFYYAQITNKLIVFNYILSNDLDGIIINPGTDDYFVPRKVILDIFNDDIVDSRFANATRYAFPVR